MNVTSTRYLPKRALRVQTIKLTRAAHSHTPQPTFHLGNPIHKSKIADVWEATADLPMPGFPYALKLFHPLEGKPDEARHRAVMGYHLGHHIQGPYVVRTRGWGHQDFATLGPRYYLSMDRAPGQNFYDWIIEDFDHLEGGQKSVFHGLDSMSFARCAALGIRDTHHASMIFGDISLSNIVFEPDNAVVHPRWVDVGSISKLDWPPNPFLSCSRNFLGNESYGSPELAAYVHARDHGTDNKTLEELWKKVDVRSDIYSLGMLFSDIYGNFQDKPVKLKALAERMTQRKPRKRLHDIEAVLHEINS